MLLGLLHYEEEDDVKQMVKKETEHAFPVGLIGRNVLSGAYEYVDVYTNESQYIVEVNLVAQFKIARPTTSYASLLELIPPIFVGKPKELKQVMKLLCKAMRESMKAEDMHLPPWRRSGYMQSKWFGLYKRTVNDVPVRPTISFRCREDFASKDGFKVDI
ncbi:uncharacterized protein LOC120174867 [Hibiscus syriacus]|uniref:uncharacterized protein LOC120174867 n=1 Tax=Hibiscus syriacus TaxID=106335 RepID=UPI001924EE3F|nr:uncharacterized protein LOC120174867 [Hibiscus syriacus]